MGNGQKKKWKPFVWYKATKHRSNSKEYAYGLLNIQLTFRSRLIEILEISIGNLIAFKSFGHTPLTNSQKSA